MKINTAIKQLLKLVYEDINDKIIEVKNLNFKNQILIIGSSAPNHLCKLLDILFEHNSELRLIVIAKSNHINIIKNLNIKNCELIYFPDSKDFSYKDLNSTIDDLKIKPESIIALINNRIGVGYENILDIFNKIKLPSFYFNSEFLFLKVKHNNIRCLKSNLSLIRHIADWNWKNFNDI